jgi:hypothetical protein
MRVVIVVVAESFATLARDIPKYHPVTGLLMAPSPKQNDDSGPKSSHRPGWHRWSTAVSGKHSEFLHEITATSRSCESGRRCFG